MDFFENGRALKLDTKDYLVCATIVQQATDAHNDKCLSIDDVWMLLCFAKTANS